MSADCREVTQNSSQCTQNNSSQQERGTRVRNSSGQTHLFYFCIFFNINFLSAIFFKFHSLNSIKSNATGQVRPAVYCLGVYCTLNYFKHHLFIVHVHWSAEIKAKPKSKLHVNSKQQSNRFDSLSNFAKLDLTNTAAWRSSLKQ